MLGNVVFLSLDLYPAKIGHLKVRHLILSVQLDRLSACVNLYSLVKLHRHENNGIKMVKSQREQGRSKRRQ